MDGHHIKRQKHNNKGLKSKIKHGEAEVFVLPPDILQKLGINLGHLDLDEHNSLDMVAKSDAPKEEKLKIAEFLNSGNCEETISETASLLKESILLTGSPSLVTTAPKIAGEIEIANGPLDIENDSKISAKEKIYLGKNETNLKEFTKTLDNVDSEEMPLHIYDKNNMIIVQDKNSQDKSKDVNQLLAVTQNNTEEEKDENRNYYESTDENRKVLKDKIRNMVVNKYAHGSEDQNLDSVGKELPENNNKTTECPVSPLNIPQIDSIELPCTTVSSKISIISEEIVDSSKLRKIKCLHSSNLPVLTPVTIKTVIKPKKTEANHAVHTDRVSVMKTSNNLLLPTINALDGEQVVEFNSRYDLPQPITLNSENVDNIPISIREHQINGACESLLEKQIELNEKNTKNINIAIPVYNNKKEINLSPVNFDELNNAENNNTNNLKNSCKKHVMINVEKLPNLTQNSIKVNSKLCVQGVEKPGGEQSENLDTIIKTYEKPKRLKMSDSSNNTKSTNDVLYPTHEVGTTEINTVVSFEEHKYEEFCICEDFGKLNFYDSDTQYEHIHFWKGVPSTVDPELIFSLYDDDHCYPCADDGLLSLNDSSEENSGDICVNYCWNRYLSKQNASKDNEVNGCNSYSEQRNVSYGKDLSKKHCKQTYENTDNLLDIKSNDDKNSNSNIDHEVVQKSLHSNIHEGNIIVQSESVITNCNNTNEAINPDEACIPSEDGNKSLQTEIIEKESILSPQAVSLEISKSCTEEKPPQILNTESNDQKASSSTTSIYNSNNESNSITTVIVTNENARPSPSEKTINNLEKPKRGRGRPRKIVKSTEGTIAANLERKSNVNTCDGGNKAVDKNFSALEKKNSITSSMNADDHITDKSLQHDEIIRIIQIVDTPPEEMGAPMTSTPVVKRCYERKSASSQISDAAKGVTDYQSQNASKIDVSPKNRSKTEESTVQSRKRRLSSSVTSELSEKEGSDSEPLSKISTRCLTRTMSTSTPLLSNENGDVVQCGVCNKSMKPDDWIAHIATEHDYLAWKEGATPLDLDDEIEVKAHLQNILRESEFLVCNTCGLKRKYVAPYLKHKRSCELNFTVEGSIDLDASIGSIVEKSTEVSYRRSRNRREDSSVISINNSHNESNNIVTINNENAHPSPSVQITNNLEKPKRGRGRPRKIVKSNESTIAASLERKSNDNTCDGDNKAVDKNFSALENKDSITSSMNAEDHITDKSLQHDEIIRIIQIVDTPPEEMGAPMTSTPVVKRCYERKSASSQISDAAKGVTDHQSQNVPKTDVSPEDRDKTEEFIAQIRKGRLSSNVTSELSERECSDSEPLSKLSTRCLTRTMRTSSSLPTNGNGEEVQCGVCNKSMKPDDWIAHIATEHDYLAWKEGATPLDLDDEIEVKAHLQNILREFDFLVCNLCGLKRKYVASYLKHKRSCEPTTFNESVVSYEDMIDVPTNEEFDSSIYVSKMNTSLKGSQEMVQCAICDVEVKGIEWIHHIGREHNYLAWLKGDTPLNVNNAAEVQKYLMSLGKKIGGLTCYKCGLIRKYAKFYWQHVELCEAENKFVVETETFLPPHTGDKMQCAVCLEEVSPKDWKRHAMNKHYNIAWVAGDIGIDLKNFYAVERYLKEYKLKHNNRLICKVCNMSKISCCGFYAHIITCGKTEEECEKYRELCDICNKKYLCIYKSQHMTMHREQEYAKERKLRLAVGKIAPQLPKKIEEPAELPSRRKAAEKANTVIAQYKEELNNGHKGADPASGYSTDSDVSVKMEQYSEDESDDSELSEVSEEEEKEVEVKRKRPVESSAPVINRIPFPVENVKSYIQESFEDLCENNLTNERLFPQWSCCEYEELREEHINKYMPTIKESCKVNIGCNGWATYERFESTVKHDVVTMFAGASIECISWAPGGGGSLLAVACHSGADSPRYNCHELFAHHNLLQIWDFDLLHFSPPKLVFGLAHDYGTIWAMDWCPSGARDLLKEEDKNQTHLRLGLLAIACSNGSAYIFSMPYPSQITPKYNSHKPFYKIKPVAELRLSSVNGDARRYQATSLRWSHQKGHNIILVGYSDGTVAYYDLCNDSPLLVSKENGMTIVHPFYDERSHTSCVTGVDVFGGGGGGGGGGVSCSASASGARVVCGAGARAAALLSPLACAGAFFLPHWPSAVLTAVNSKVHQTVNEVEWQCARGARGRRVGGVRARACCACCGAVAAAADPLVRVLRAHPAHPDIAKHVAAILQMGALAQKRKQTNDELAMKIEPLTYDDAVQKYGIEFQLLSKTNKVEQQKALSMPMPHYPERFPLAEITSMAFCPTMKHHNKLAIATHAGIVFLVNVV